MKIPHFRIRRDAAGQVVITMRPQTALDLQASIASSPHPTMHRLHSSLTPHIQAGLVEAAKRIAKEPKP